jgi:putative membrane protein
MPEPDEADGVDGADVRHVDYRFLLANERTFLAWIRTALGIIAGGVALDQFVVIEGEQGWVAQLAILTIFLGAVIAVVGTVRWSRADRVMREGRPMARSRGVVVVGLSVAAVAVVVGVLLAVR